MCHADGFLRLFPEKKTLMFVGLKVYGHNTTKMERSAIFFCSKNNPTPNQIAKSENRQGIDSYLNISDYMKFDIFYL